MHTEDFPQLNWNDIAYQIELLRPYLQNTYVDRVFIPERKHFLKGQFVLTLNHSAKKIAFDLLLSIRARECFFYLLNNKQLRPDSNATHSAFTLYLSQNLRGQKLLDIRAIKNERWVVISFSKFNLWICMIPSNPFTCITTPDDQITLIHSKGDGKHFSKPESQINIKQFEINDLFKNIKNPIEISHIFENLFDQKIFNTQKESLNIFIKDQILKSNKLIESEKTIEKSHLLEKRYQKWGLLLQTYIYLNIAVSKNQCFEIPENEPIPAPSGLDMIQSAQYYFKKAKREQRKAHELIEKNKIHIEKVSKATHIKTELEKSKTWSDLDKIKNLLGLDTILNLKSKKALPWSNWEGRVLQSTDNKMILIGRSKEENLQLTFKISKGKDLWLHIKGKPSAHCVIPLNPGKSAALETIIDAAHLLIYYSKGESWGKTEVDYTFRKFVKRIKNSNEVSYSNNKTILIQYDKTRTQKLIAHSIAQSPASVK